MNPREFANALITNRRATRTRRGQPCPVCGHQDGHCLRMEDGSAALCPKSDGTGSVKRYGAYGHLYLLASGSVLGAMPMPVVSKRPERTDAELDAIWRPRAVRWCERGQDEIGKLAMQIGVTTAALRALDTGWDGSAWTTPERNGEGLIVGVSRRFPDGGKRCAVGSRRGLTYALGWMVAEGPILIVEGASDVAAGITLGLPTIGRPSNLGGLKMLKTLLRNRRRKVIVVAERDRKEDGRWPGMEGARTIAKGLGRRTVARLLPHQAKDLRAWLTARQVDLFSAASREAARRTLLKRL